MGMRDDAMSKKPEESTKNNGRYHYEEEYQYPTSRTEFHDLPPRTPPIKKNYEKIEIRVTIPYDKIGKTADYCDKEYSDIASSMIAVDLAEEKAEETLGKGLKEKFTLCYKTEDSYMGYYEVTIELKQKTQ
jgi:hypothetical protein